MSPTDRKQGVVKRLILEKGFGFLTGPTDDVFMHVTGSDPDLFNDLEVGEQVTYIEQKSPKGLRAVDIQRI